MKKSSNYMIIVIILTCLYVSLFIVYLDSREFVSYLGTNKYDEIIIRFEEVGANEPIYWLSLGISLFSFVFLYKFFIHKKREFEQVKVKVDH